MNDDWSIEDPATPGRQLVFLGAALLLGQLVGCVPVAPGMDVRAEAPATASAPEPEDVASPKPSLATLPELEGEAAPTQPLAMKFPAAGERPQWTEQSYAALRARFDQPGTVSPLSEFNDRADKLLTLMVDETTPVTPALLASGSAKCRGPSAPVALGSAKGPVGWAVIRCKATASPVVELDIWIEAYGRLITQRIEPTAKSALYQIPFYHIYNLGENAEWARVIGHDTHFAALSLERPNVGEAYFQFDEALFQRTLDENIVLVTSFNKLTLETRPQFERGRIRGRQVPAQTNERIKLRSDELSPQALEDFLLLRATTQTGFPRASVSNGHVIDVAELRDRPDGKRIGWALLIMDQDEGGLSLQMWLPETGEIIADLAKRPYDLTGDRNLHFRISAHSGDWVRMTAPDARRSIWMNFKDATLNPLFVVTLEDEMSMPDPIVPIGSKVEIFRAPDPQSRPVAVYSTDEDFYTLLIPTGRFDGQWMEVRLELFEGGRCEPYRVYEPGEDESDEDILAAQMALQTPDAVTIGWIQYRDGRRPLVRDAAFPCAF